jgi:type IV pilus biogenesis protein CpaD/CtpE
MKTNPTIVLLAALTAVLAGCTSAPPTLGEQMITQSKETRDLGKQWKSGQDMVARGEKLKSEGQDMIAQGEQRVKEGERLVTEGNAAMQESELIFKERFPGQTLVPAE